MADEKTEERAARKTREARVISTNMDKTIVVAVEDKVRHPLYGKTMQRSRKLHVHDETNDANVGDTVRVMETRPLSKLKRWRLVEIVERADRPNGGVCVDIWHHARGANDLDLIRAIPDELIVGIQMSDGTTEPALDDYKDDCLRNRQPPGTGDFDAVGFAQTLLDKGVDVPWSIEACNDDAWSGDGAEAHVTACVEALRDVLSTARS